MPLLSPPQDCSSDSQPGQVFNDSVCIYVCTYVRMYVYMYEWMAGCMYVCMDGCMYGWMDVWMDVCMYGCMDVLHLPNITCQPSNHPHQCSPQRASAPAALEIARAEKKITSIFPRQRKILALAGSSCPRYVRRWKNLKLSFETEHRGFAFRRGKQFSNSPVSRFCFSHALRVRMGMVATFLRSCSIPGQPGSISKLFFPEVFSRALITPQQL